MRRGGYREREGVRRRAQAGANAWRAMSTLCDTGMPVQKGNLGNERTGSFSEILKISQIFCPTLSIYRYFIALIQTFCISVVRTYTILSGIYVYLLFD